MRPSGSGDFRRRSDTGLTDRSRKLSEAQREVLRNEAARVQFSRRLRRKLFGSEMFAETAWDILLTLYLADGHAARSGPAELAQMSEAPFSTTLRWLSYLDGAGLVRRTEGQGRDLFAGTELSDKGRHLLDSYFVELHEAQIFGPSERGEDAREE